MTDGFSEPRLAARTDLVFGKRSELMASPCRAGERSSLLDHAEHTASGYRRGDFGAFTARGTDRDLAAEAFDDLANRREPDTAAGKFGHLLRGTAGATERVESPGIVEFSGAERIPRDARAVIAHAHGEYV